MHHVLHIISIWKIEGFRKNCHDNPADFFLDKIMAVEQGQNVPRQYQASDGRYKCNHVFMFCSHMCVYISTK